MGSDTLMKTCYVPPLLPPVVRSPPPPTAGEGVLKRKKNWAGMNREKEKDFIAKRKKRNKDRIDIDSCLMLQYVFSGMSKVRVKQSYRQGYCSLMF